MSIASQIERIQNEVTTQEDLINQITTALQGKAAGGGSSGGASLDTCTVTIAPFGWDETGEKLCYVSATIVENDNYTAYTQVASELNSSLGAVTINNVLCGSVITLCLQLYYVFDPYVEASGTSKFIKWDMIGNPYSGLDNKHYVVIQAPTVAGEQATINFSYEP